jgi:N-acetylmuramoyl-L-alanine amidase
MRRPTSRIAVAALAAAAFLGACGSSERKPAERVVAKPQAPVKTVTIDQIERMNAARRQRRRRNARAPTPTPTSAVRAPAIVKRFIPFPATREQEMAAYAERHYGIHGYRLENPKVIVEHYTVSADAASAIKLFSSDVADSELHELPGTCSHFVIDSDGTIYQLVPLSIMCRHTVGLNYTSIGVEHAGFSDEDILGNPAELDASLRLTSYLRCRYGIEVRNVIGHNESLSSPYHRENVTALRSQTHEDWTRADMDIYRSKIADRGC